MNKKQRAEVRTLYTKLLEVLKKDTREMFLQALGFVFMELSNVCLNCEIALSEIPEWSRWYEKSEDELDTLADAVGEIEDMLDEDNEVSLSKMKDKLNDILNNLNQVIYY